MSTGSDLEDRLTALFRRQAKEVTVPDATWAEAGTTAAAGVARPRRIPMFALGGVAAACLVLALSLTTRKDPPAQVRTSPAAQGTAPPAATSGQSKEVTATTAPIEVAGGPLRVATRQVSLTADAVTIDAGGRQFVTVQPVQLRGDPGNASYTTLELTWQEHGVEMRLYIYFSADDREWWSDEIRTYDGSAQGDWITYKGDFFRSPLREPFTGDFTVATPDPTVGRLHLANARLNAFLPAPECADAGAPFVLDPGTDLVTIEGLVSGYGVAVELLDRATCKVVADQDRYVYEWTTADPDVVTVGRLPMPGAGLPRNAQLTPVAQGRAAVHVTARDPSSGAIVAETDIDVVVGDVQQLPPSTVTRQPPSP